MSERGSRPFAKGFTLIELLVVIVLIGLLASIGLTTVGSGNQGRALNNEVNRLHAVLTYGLRRGHLFEHGNRCSF